MSRRELPRCTAHGLAYDPDVQDGCTLCRNSLGSGADRAASSVAWKDIAMVTLMAMWVCGILSAAYFGFNRMGELRSTFAAKRDREKKDHVVLPMPEAPLTASLWDTSPPPVPTELPMIGPSGVTAFGYPKATVDRLGIQALLRAREFATLTRYLEQLQTEFEADFRKEGWVTDAFDAFGTADPVVGQRIDEWLASDSSSFAPILARAKYRVAVAWYYRGGGFSGDTARDRLDKFKALLGDVEPDLTRALGLRPKLIVAYQVRLALAAGLGEKNEKRAILDAATALCKECFRVRALYMMESAPRWGGSYAEMEREATEAQAYLPQNPKLKVLLGYASSERARDYSDQKMFAAALEAADHSVAVADYYWFRDIRARVLLHDGRKQEALADMDSVIEQAPRDTEYLITRAQMYLGVDRLEDGVNDLRTAALLDPTFNRVIRELDTAVKKLIYVGYQRFVSGDNPGAIAAYDLALTLSPGNADALARKAAAATNDDDVAKLESAAEANPTDFTTYKSLDDALFKTGQFKRIVAHWDRYLAARPGDARAHMERGGARLHAGDTAGAIADLDEGCAGGVEQSCAGARYARSRAP